MFIFAADSLQQLAYSDCLRSAMLLLFLVYLSSSQKNKAGYLVLICALFLLQTLTGWDHAPYMVLFFIMSAYLFKPPRAAVSKKALFLLLLIPAAAFMIHFLRNIWYYHGLGEAFSDMRDIAIERVANSKDSSVPFTPVNWLQYVIARNFSLNLLFNYFTLTVGAFAFYLMYQPLKTKDKSRIIALLKLSAVLAVCGISWFVLFPAHSLAHTYVLFLARALVPFASVVFGAFFYAAFCYLRERPGRVLIKDLILAVVIIDVAMIAVFQSELPVTKEAVAASEDFLLFKKDLFSLKERSSPRDVVGVNYFRFPFMAYYLDRRCVVIFDRYDMLDASKRPKYFMFVPYKNQPAGELYKFLKQHYNVLFYSGSQRFPIVFFELKNKKAEKIRKRRRLERPAP
jgi:hypothetical protein